MVKNTGSGKHEKIVAEEFKRRQGYDMIEKGLKNSVIAEKLQVDRMTVYNWRLRKEREIDWKRRKQKGATCRLSEKQKEKLKKIIAEVIEKEFGVHYNTTYIWQVLDTMGYS